MTTSCRSDKHMVSDPSMLKPGLQENCTSVSYTKPVEGATLPSCGVPG